MRSERPHRAGARLHVTIAAAMIAFVVLPASPANAATINVTTTNDELNADGDCSMREAIAAANLDVPVSGCPAGSGPDQINLPAGLYSIGINEPTEAGNSQGDFDLHSDITITGAGPALTTVGAGKTDRVFEHHSFGNTSSINQLTVRNGDATTSVGFQGGGGIFNGGGSNLTLDNVVVRGSTAPEGGGGIFNFGSLTVTNSAITGNSSPASFGGGIASQLGQLTLQSSSVTLNTAQGAGGIKSDGNLTITDSTISMNTATAFSAGGVNNDGFAILTNNTISDNTGNIGAGIDNHGQLTIEGGNVTGNDANEQGGGIRNTGGNLGMTGVTVDDNSASDGGGGLATFGQAHLTNVDFSGNTTEEGGGAIRAGGELHVTGGTIDGNQAALSGCCGGGGISVDGNAFVTLQGVTLSNNFSAQDAGGAIFNFGRLELLNTTVTGNSVDGQGGGIHNDPGGFLRMTGGELSGNTATFSGGGLSAEGQNEDGGSWTGLDGVLVESNTAPGGGGIAGQGPEARFSISNSTIIGNGADDGGGIRVGPASATITNSSISGNVADFFGGGIAVGNGTLLLEGSEVTGNAAPLGQGGGIALQGDIGIGGPVFLGTMVVRESTIHGNAAGDQGGGIFNDGLASLVRSTVSGNSVELAGGGIADGPHASMTVRDSTISGNEAEYGGGISEQGNLVLFQSTVSGNTADVEGGGLQVWTNHGPIGGGGEGNALFRFSTLARNSAPFAAAYNNQAGESEVVLENTIIGDSVGGADCEWRFHSGGYNIIENPGPSCSGTGATSTDLIGVDPRLGALAANGGPTMTHALRPGSPAIDSAHPNCPPPHADQRGVPRGFPDGCDRGAFERFQGGLLFFELHDAQVTSGRVQADGSLLCAPAGHRWRADLSVTQGAATGRTTIGGICTGEEQPWNAVVRPRKGSPPFAPGAAVWCQDVRTTTPAGAQTDGDQECFEVELQ